MFNAQNLFDSFFQATGAPQQQQGQQPGRTYTTYTGQPHPNFNTSQGNATYYQSGGSASSSSSRPRNADYVPPASKRVIDALPEVVITKKDLFLDGGKNAECSICLEEQKLSGTGTKLPCGHIFCKDCISDWLHKQCTCPVCRFELQTTDAQFEKERLKRQRKAKYKRMDLSRMTVKELKAIVSANGIENKGFAEKRDFVEAICNSGTVDIIDDDDDTSNPQTPSGTNTPSGPYPDPLNEYYAEDLAKMNVEQLRNTFKLFNLVVPSAVGTQEKDELIGLLMNSGKISRSRS